MAQFASCSRPYFTVQIPKTQKDCEQPTRPLLGSWCCPLQVTQTVKQKEGNSICGFCLNRGPDSEGTVQVKRTCYRAGKKKSERVWLCDGGSINYLWYIPNKSRGSSVCLWGRELGPGGSTSLWYLLTFCFETFILLFWVVGRLLI